MPPKGSQKAVKAESSSAKPKPKPKSQPATPSGSTTKTAAASKAAPAPSPKKPAAQTTTPRKKKEPVMFKSMPRDPNDPPFQIDLKYEGKTVQAQEIADGVFGHNLKLEACSPFKILKMVKYTDGEFEGCEAIIVQPARPFPFLKLPKEIRARIYTFYFAPNRITHSEIALEGKRTNKDIFAKMYSEGSKYRVGLLTVNKEVYDEALPILYSHMMRFESTTTALDFFGQLENSVRPRIINISIKSYLKTTARNAMHFLAESPNITTLYIESGVYAGDDPAKAAKEFYDTAYKFLEAVGARKGDKTAGVDICFFGKDALTFKPGEDKKKEGWDEEMVEDFKEELKARLN